ncbi:spindle and centriole-associated protein 1 [Lampris incognitus]|uniref:spindle and centriole-associated protein 1 n=1 Tax=Lampris incognitus TaxID=2546036 RepID=UPI0024B56F9A|nr:spindle and centriole-associated protein 1 [Lampris incognitus]
MSFVRAGRSHRSQGKRPPRSKKSGTPKRDWVSTVNDLTVHKLTPEELRHRHEIHKSHNRAAAQWELREKALKQRFRQPGSPAPLDKASLTIIREVFSDQLLLQDVLARSDKAMAVVKDLFGDAPRRHIGHPSVTMAPDCDSSSVLPVVQRPDPPTQLSLLSQSTMDQQALNEIESSEEDYSEEDTCPTASSNPVVVHRTNLLKKKAKAQQQKAQSNSGYQQGGDGGPVTPCTTGRGPDQAALNATAAVKRLRSRLGQSEDHEEEPSRLITQVLNPEATLKQSGRRSGRSSRTRKSRSGFVSESPGLDCSAVSSASGNQSGLGLLQAMLEQVEAELDSLGCQEAHTAPGVSPNLDPHPHKTQGLAGFSVALISTLGRLVHLLKQREEDAQKKATEFSRLEEEVKEQRGLIDALTAETLALREESATLQAGLQCRTAELEQRLDTMVLALGELGLMGLRTDDGPEDRDIRATVRHSRPPFPGRDPEQTQASVSPAVLLSPPQQRDSQQHSPGFHPVLLHQERPLLDTLCYCEDAEAYSHASSLSGLPVHSLSSLPLQSFPSTSSLDPTSNRLRSQLSQEAMLAEIAQLGRQNDLIRNQLNQANGLCPGVRGSLDSSIDRRGSSPSSTGRAIPQAVGDGRMLGSSNAGQRTQQIQHLPRQSPQHDIPSMSSVEQRLLELNKQSAVARSRLLELIEQQKHSASARVSRSVSPIPPSAISPHTAERGGTPESSMDLLSQPGGGGSRSAGEVTSQRNTEQTRNGKTQTGATDIIITPFSQV